MNEPILEPRLKKFIFSLSRTRLQSATITLEARTEEEAEAILEGLIERAGDSDGLARRLAFTWSDGEDEGEIDVDLESEA